MTPPPMMGEPAKPAETYPSMSPTNELRLGPNFSFRPGFQVQSWTEFLQDAVKQPNGDAGAFQFNTYVRRARIFFGGTIFKKVSYFILTEAANLGRSATAAGATTKVATYQLLDAYLSYNIMPEFSIQAGSMLVPMSRQTVQSTTTYISLDILTTSATNLAALQTNVLRDTGIQFKGIINEHFEYRLGFFQGLRQNPTPPPEGSAGSQGGKNSPRTTLYLQYNFLDPEAGYVFAGQNFGHKNVAGLAVGLDYQALDGNVAAYYAATAAAFTSQRLNGNAKDGGDEVAALVLFQHLKSSNPLRPAPAGNNAGGFFDQNDLGVELAYYNRELRTSVFGKLELRFNDNGDITQYNNGELRIFGGGLKWLINEAQFNMALAFNRIQLPNNTAVNDQNQIIFQIQFFYF